MITDSPLIVEPGTPATAAIIWLHGLGADGHDFADLPGVLTHKACSSTRFIFPHAPVRPITLNASMPMRGWYDITSLVRTDEQDSDGLMASQQYVEDMIDEQIQQGIAAERIVLGGFSQGGALALYAGARTRQPLAGVIALSGYLPDARRTPIAQDAPPILMMHGDQDDIVHPSLGKESADALKAGHYEVAYETYPVAHGICAQQFVSLSERLASWVA